jgi:hypothetical protein
MTEVCLWRRRALPDQPRSLQGQDGSSRQGQERDGGGGGVKGGRADCLQDQLWMKSCVCDMDMQINRRHTQYRHRRA